MKLLKRLENIFSAVAFAEAGEHETARQILKENDEDITAGRRQKRSDRGKKQERIPYPSRA